MHISNGRKITPSVSRSFSNSLTNTFKPVTKMTGVYRKLFKMVTETMRSSNWCLCSWRAEWDVSISAQLRQAKSELAVFQLVATQNNNSSTGTQGWGQNNTDTPKVLIASWLNTPGLILPQHVKPAAAAAANMLALCMVLKALIQMWYSEKLVSRCEGMTYLLLG